MRPFDGTLNNNSSMSGLMQAANQTDNVTKNQSTGISPMGLEVSGKKTGTKVKKITSSGLNDRLNLQTIA